MSGSGGDTGYDYQANVIAYIAAHGLAEQPLPWFDDEPVVILSWSAETAGPGDDIALHTTSGKTIEIQAKHALARGPEYLETFRKLFVGLTLQPELRAVLIVDRHASNVIRDELKSDLERLGQGRSDRLKSVTLELLASLEQPAHQSILSRLKIVVIDLDEGSDGTSAAHGLLSQIVPKHQAATAYELLGKRGHKLIKTRGQDDVVRCAKYLDSRIGLVVTNKSSAVSFAQFQSLVTVMNSQFYSPALQRQFASMSAWSSVTLMKEEGSSQERNKIDLERELRRYQEWSRLAAKQGQVSRIEADMLLKSVQHLTIVGGPGSGKTTLSKKLTFLASKDHVTLRVRLPLIAARMRGGSSFDSAMTEAVIEAVGGTTTGPRSILMAANYLIADGLDECDPSRSDIASSLERWAVSHPDLRICVMTRPVGHSPSLLPSFEHAELLPLDDHEIRTIANVLIGSHIQGKTECAQAVRDFMEAIGARSENKTATIAARNPLLLSFLVRLFLDGESLDGNRSELFARIIDLIRRSYPAERNPSTDGTPDRATAWGVAEAAGWSTIEKPERELAALYDLVGTYLGGGFSNARLAESALHLWSDHGLIERVTVGAREVIVFVHLSLGEYLAGRFLARTSSEFLEAHVKNHRRRAKWRETILFAAASGAHATIISLLLSLDDPEDPESTEATLAAACIGELSGGTPLYNLPQLIADKLTERLSSPIPLIAIEAGEALQKISSTAPEFISEISLSLWDHEQPWTRTASICAGISTAAKAIPIEKIVKWLEADQRWENKWDLQIGSFAIPAGHELRKGAVPVALKRVAEELPSTKAKEIVVSYLSQAHVSTSIMQEVRALLKGTPGEEWVAEAWSRAMSGLSDKDFLSQMRAGQDQSRLGEQVILDCISTIGEESISALSESPDRFFDLGTLISSMGYWEMHMGDVASIDRESAAEVTEIIRLIARGLKLDHGRVKSETEVMRANLKLPGGRLWELPQNKQEPDWEALRAAKVDVTLLGKALAHPSQLISWNAMRLLNGRTFSTQERASLQDEFSRANRNLRFWGAIASQLWEERAFELLHLKLAHCKSSLCGDLYLPLIKSARNESELQLAIQLTIAGVGLPAPARAQKAAEALEEIRVSDIRENCEELSALLLVWKERGSWCWRCQKEVKGSSCENCHIVPPSPRGALVRVMARAGCLSLDRLFSLCQEHEFGVDEEARAALLVRAEGDSEARERLVAAIDNGATAFISDVMKGDNGQKQAFSPEFKFLCGSSSPAVRTQIVGSLGQGWLSVDEARTIASAALKDDAPSVRSAAVRVLRELGAKQQG